METFELLEKKLTEWCGYETVCCSTGTSALHLALESLQLPIGSAVLLADYAMIACARAVTLAGLVPVFVDVGKDLLIDVDLIDKACSEYSPKRRYAEDDISAIMPVHTYGRRCDMGAITDLAAKYDLAVVEDLAECHGVKPHEKSDAAIWSYYKNKIVHGEEGGSIAYPRLADKSNMAQSKRRQILARQLRCLGFTDAHDFTHIPRGHNYRMSNVHAQLILDSLADVNANLQSRRRIELMYDALCPPEWKQPPREVVWVYDLRIPVTAGKNYTLHRIDSVVKALNEVGIAARHGFKPLSRQEEYRPPDRDEIIANEGIVQSYAASREVIYLPVIPNVTTETSVRLAFETIKKVLA